MGCFFEKAHETVFSTAGSEGGEEKVRITRSVHYDFTATTTSTSICLWKNDAGGSASTSFRRMTTKRLFPFHFPPHPTNSPPLERTTPQSAG